MPDFKIQPTQKDGTLWEEPPLWTKGNLFTFVVLPDDHPYRQCQIENSRLLMANSLEGYATPYIKTPPLTSPADLLTIPLGARPSEELLEEMDNRSKERKKSNLLQSQKWRKECAKVYDGSIYKGTSKNSN